MEVGSRPRPSTEVSSRDRSNHVASRHSNLVFPNEDRHHGRPDDTLGRGEGGTLKEEEGTVRRAGNYVPVGRHTHWKLVAEGMWILPPNASFNHLDSLGQN